ncbi:MULTISPECIES: SRPBCC family protein [Streptomyces]|uniref:SRPBCC family protein n=1 Tax=Streptomyces TaxID=1883 RepID=UPI00030F1617|nr:MULTISPECIES: SRPBCC family protein [Streptomyces]MBY8870078.1 SRPBCC family protein [Streptomyces sennicomposti]NED77320.1 SRPBCC family protein [Streptomyces sp. SID9944]
MTEALGTAKSAADKAAKDSPLSALAHSEAADRLKAEAQEYLSAQAERLLAGFGRKLGETTGKLNDIAEGNSPGFAKMALEGGRKLAEGKGPVRSALEVGVSHAKDSVMGAFKNLGGGGKGKSKRGGGNKPTVIIESIDVGVPQRTAYDQWTQFQDFSTFAKGVKSASRADDTTSDWQAKIWWSSRSWKATTTEQIPDYRIQWTSEGAKGSTKGVVSFHELEENLTRVLLVIEYYPSGFFEKTGNIWRAQGRRARLDLKNFARFITLKGEAEDGWRGEIRDGEVVRSHEDAVAEEEEEAQQSDEGEEPEEDEQAGEAAAEDGQPEAEDEEGYEDEDEEPYAEDEEEGPYAEEDEEEDGDYEEEPREDAEEGEPEGELDEEEPEEEQPEEEYEYSEGGSRR